MRPPSGRTVFTVANTTPRTVYSVVLATADQTRIFGQIKTLNPSTELPLDVVLPPGEYAFVCATRSGYSLVSPRRGGARRAGHGRASVHAGLAADDAAAPRSTTTASLRPVMQRLVRDTDRLDGGRAGRATGRGTPALDPGAPRLRKLGVAYDTFGRFNDEINQQPFGLPGGVHDPNFRGFLRLEYGLWHGQSRATLAPIATALDRSVHGLLEELPEAVGSAR